MQIPLGLFFLKSNTKPKDNDDNYDIISCCIQGTCIQQWLKEIL